MIFLGDIHANFSYLTWYIKHGKISNESIIQVGDYGLGFTSYENDLKVQSELNNTLKKNNITLYTIRGNHDNPYFWDGHLDGHFSNIHYLKDYSVLNIEGFNMLFIGGALSIDRKYRLKQMQTAASYGRDIELYWFDEPFILDKEKMENIKNIDIVVTHTSPDFCVPVNKFGFSPIVDEYAHYDKTLKDELIEERKTVTEMWNILKKNSNPRIYLYGHFHSSNFENIDGCEFRLLGINEWYNYKGKDYEDELNKLYGK